MGEDVPQRTLDRLIGEVTRDARESFLLLKALRHWADSDTPILVERLLDEHARRQKLDETRQKDIDEVVSQGVVSLPTALLVGVAVGLLAKTIAWPMGALVILVAVAAMTGLGVERLWIRASQRALSQEREETESLARAVGDLVKALPHGGWKSRRKGIYAGIASNGEPPCRRLIRMRLLR